MSTDASFPAPPVAAPNNAPSADAALLTDAPVQTHKLDADLYMAGDLDGITESLFGSGNLNYLLLQARQTDAAGSGNGFDGMDAALADPYAPSWLLAAAKNIAAGLQPAGMEGALFGTNAADGLNSGPVSAFAGNDAARALSGDGIDGNILANIARLMDAPPEGSTVNDSDDNTDDDDGDDGDNGGGDNGGGDNGGGDNGGGDNGGGDNGGGDNGGGDNGGGDNGGNNGGNNGGDIDILGDNNIGLPVIDINLDPLENIVGDIDLGIGIGFDPDDGLTIDLDTVLLDIPVLEGGINIDIPLLNPVIGEVLTIADPVVDIVTGIAQPLLDGISTTVESVIGSLLGAPPPMNGDYDLQVHTDLGIPNLDVNLDVLENMIGDIDIALGLDVIGGDGIGITLDGLVADLPVINLDTQINVPVIMPVVNGALAPMSDMLSDLTAPETLAGLFDNPAEAAEDIMGSVVGSLQDIVAGTTEGIVSSLEDTLGSIGQSDHSADDSDLAVQNDIGLPQIDINLDAVENITGDIDLGLSLNSSDNGLTVGLDTTIAGINLLDDISVAVDIPLVSPVIAEVLEAASPVLGGVTSAVQPVLDDVSGIVENLTDNLLTPPPPDGADDTDIAVHNNIGLPQIDINLDTVENITGDIDLGLGLQQGDDGLTIGLDTTLAGIQLLDDVSVTVDIPLVTPVAGEVIDIAQSLLGEAASDEGTAHGAMALLDGTAQGAEDVLSTLLGSGPQGGGDAAWPQLDAGALLGSEGLGGLMGGITDGALHLPEPVGNIVEGLGLLPSGSDHGGGLLSGLFNGHGGGLFG